MQLWNRLALSSRLRTRVRAARHEHDTDTGRRCREDRPVRQSHGKTFSVCLLLVGGYLACRLAEGIVDLVSGRLPDSSATSDAQCRPLNVSKSIRSRSRRIVEQEGGLRNQVELAAPNKQNVIVELFDSGDDALEFGCQFGALIELAVEDLQRVEGDGDE
jgi:hypothetical protein